MPSLWAATLDEHRRLVLGRLLDAYEELHREVGIEGVTLSAVAQRAGLARSAIYNYVGDKHELVLAHAERTLERATEQVRATVVAQRSPTDRLIAYIRVTLRQHATETGAGDDLMPMLSPEEQGMLLAMLAPVRTLLERIAADGVAAGLFRPPAEDVVTVVWALLAGLRQPVASGRIDAERAADIATSVLLDGIRPPPVSPHQRRL